MTICPAKSAFLASRDQLDLAKVDAAGLVVARDCFRRAVNVDRLVVAGGAQHRHQALRLAECVGADKMCALRKERDRPHELRDLSIRMVMAENRQAERRFGDEDVAGYQLEWCAGRIGDVLVVAGGDYAEVLAFNRICAEPSTWPAGWKLTRAPSSFKVSP